MRRLHVYAGWEYQPPTKNVSGTIVPWRAHWFNYSLEGQTSADFIDVGITYDHSPQQVASSGLSGWEARLQCVLGTIPAWPATGKQYPCIGEASAIPLSCPSCLLS